MVDQRLPFPRGTSGGICGLMLIALVCYWPTTSPLWHRPVFGASSLLVALLSAWLLFRARDRLDAAPARSMAWVSLLQVACSVAALLIWQSGMTALQMILLPVLLLLAVTTAFGPRVARVAAIPLAYLYFAVPAWDLLAEPMQRLTLRIVGWLAPVVGIPAIASGTLLLLPTGDSFEVTLSCSGSGFLMEGLAVAVLLGELETARFRRRLRLIGGVVVLALAVNWLRVLTLVGLGYATGMRAALVTDYHVEFGYLLFIVALVGFVGLASRGAAAEHPSPGLGTGVARPDPGATGAGYGAAVLGLAAVPALYLAGAWVRDRLH